MPLLRLLFVVALTLIMIAFATEYRPQRIPDDLPRVVKHERTAVQVLPASSLYPWDDTTRIDLALTDADIDEVMTAVYADDGAIMDGCMVMVGTIEDGQRIVHLSTHCVDLTEPPFRVSVVADGGIWNWWGTYNLDTRELELMHGGDA